MWYEIGVIIAILAVLISVLRSKLIFGNGLKQVAVVVLGDIGHSPRMQYHALSLANMEISSGVTPKVLVKILIFQKML